MARNKEVGDNRRVGAVKKRSQIKNKLTGTWTKRDDDTGKFLDVKDDAKPFKGVRKPAAKSKVKVKVKAVAKKVAAKKPAAKKLAAKKLAVKPAKKAAKKAKR